MNFSQGQTGSYTQPAANQRRHDGRVKVLPSFPPPASPQQNLSQRANGPFNYTRPADYSGISQGYQSQPQPTPYAVNLPNNQGFSTTPRLPPPPKTQRASNTQRTGRLEDQTKFSHNLSVQDLRYVGNAERLEESTQIPTNTLYDKHRFNKSVHDLRDVGTMPVKPQQSARPLSYYQNTNGLGINAFLSLQEPKIQQPEMSAMPFIQPNQGFSLVSSVPIVEKTAKSEMSSLHDELAQLKLELAAMKDPMREHEEWLKSQSVQVKELEELQKQLLSNIENNNTNNSNKNLSNDGASSLPINYSTVSTAAVPKSNNHPPPKTLKPSSVVTPKADYRPPITSPKPIKLKPMFNTTTPPKPSHDITAPSKPEVVKNVVHNKNSSSDQPKQIVSSFKNQIEETKKPVLTSSSDIKVKRISQIFEANGSPMKGTETKIPKQNYDAKNRHGSVKKISPALLRSIQALEETKISSIPLPSDTRLKSNNVISIPSLSMTTGSSAPSKSLLAKPNVTESSRKPSVINSVPQPFDKPSVQSSEAPLSSKYSQVIPSLAKQAVPTLPRLYPTAIVPPSSSTSPYSSSDPSSYSKPKTLPIAPPSSSKPIELSNTPSLSTNPTDFPIVPPSFSKSEEIHINPSSQSKPSDHPIASPLSPKSSALPSSTSSAKPALPLPSEVHKELSSAIHSALSKKTQSSSTTKDELEQLPSGPVIQSQYQHESISDGLDAYFPATSVESKAQADTFKKHRYENVPIKLEFDNSSKIPSLPTMSNSSLESLSYPSRRPETTATSRQSGLYIPTSAPIRPNTPPPPPPTAILQNSQTLSQPPPPPPVIDQQFVESQPSEIASPSTVELRASNAPQTLGIPTLRTPSSGSERSSLSSLPGSPLSPSSTASKSDLLEQIRQFKQSGKNLKRASSEVDDSNGTPTRVRKNSMHDVLQTRFHAFCGNQSESSDEDDDANKEEDDWDD